MKKVLILIMFTTSLFSGDWIDSAMKTYDNTINTNYSKKEKTTEKFEEKESLKQKRFDEIWENVFPNLKEGAELQKDILNAPDSAWFSTDKNDIQTDINDVLSNIFSTLIDDDLLKYKDDIEGYLEGINELKEKISIYIEKKITAPRKHMILTTKSGYDEKIQNSKDKIKYYQKKIELVKSKLLQSFKAVDISISQKQLDRILASVDGEDIIQSMMIFDIMTQINNQLSELTTSSGEELSTAKRYYGMFLVSSQFIVYIQEKYRYKLQNIYMVRLDAIEKENIKVIEETETYLSNESNDDRKKQYESNLNIQKENKEVIEFYKTQLEEQLKSLNKAILESKKTSLLAKNTFKTVSTSAKLSSLIDGSMKDFAKVMKLQMPKLRPFKNNEIKKKYSLLTKQLKMNK